MAKALDINVTTTTSATPCFCRIVMQVHIDKFKRLGIREYYTAMTYAAILQGCNQVTEENNMMSILAMTWIFVTPFANDS